MRYPNERLLLRAHLISGLIAFVLLASVFGLLILFPEWGFIPKIILLGIMVATLGVTVILIIYKRKKYVEKLL